MVNALTGTSRWRYSARERVREGKPSAESLPRGSAPKTPREWTPQIRPESMASRLAPLPADKMVAAACGDQTGWNRETSRPMGEGFFVMAKYPIPNTQHQGGHHGQST